jgi:hypothetical protein
MIKVLSHGCDVVLLENFSDPAIFCPDVNWCGGENFHRPLAEPISESGAVDAEPVVYGQSAAVVAFETNCDQSIPICEDIVIYLAERVVFAFECVVDNAFQLVHGIAVVVRDVQPNFVALRRNVQPFRAASLENLVINCDLVQPRIAECGHAVYGRPLKPISN